ncbi:hypothetical protein SHANETTE_120 [Bacillus phage Shanette]|uniref:Holin n=1 Tax=Bacillus phage Shanette TaxID=1296656 RepID=S5MB66_9CAUD|nr:holin [Bacillus phage Shanette]AGR47014.1 hypothetical protein SHANETTE_120 [Bacillus phage Shanette]
MNLLDLVTQIGAEVVTILVGALLALVLDQGRRLLKRAKQKDELGIIDSITNQVVEYAEAELKGKKGIEKRDWAVDQALHILATKGIHLSQEEVIAGIENGVRKLKAKDDLSIDGLSQR